MYFNVREKSFPDGLIQATRYERYRYKGKRNNLKKRGGPAMHGSGATIERKEIENMKRAKQMVWDLGRANSFDWWITLTFAPEQVDDRYDYKCCCEALKRFTKYLGKHHCRWLIVPDQHKDGAFHFHGLLSGDLTFTRSLSPNTGRPLFDNHGRPRYNIDDYKLGYTSAVPLDGCPAVITYLTEYYTKNQKMHIPKGCKRYWASRSLARPEVSYGSQDIMTFLRTRYVGADYTRTIHSRFGSSILAETNDEYIYSQEEKLAKETEAELVSDESYWEEDWDGTWSTQQNKNNVGVPDVFDFD